MALKLDIWATEADAKKELAKRLSAAKEWRQRHERQWIVSENSVYNTRGLMLFNNTDTNYFSDVSAMATGDIESGTADVGVNYLQKNIRFIHSQLSSNPPAVITRPSTSDSDDRRKADAADRTTQYIRNEYDLQEKFDLLTLPTLIYGTGWIKTIYDSTKGEILEVDEEGNLILEGDFSITVPSIWDVWGEPCARFEDSRFIFERIYIPYEEACYRFPGKEDLLKKFIKTGSSTETQSGQPERKTTLNAARHDVVEIYEYWEKGLPSNGMRGRFCYILPSGDLLSPLRDNPHRFKYPNSGKLKKLLADGTIKKLPEYACLPYHILTDVDIPDSYMGKAALDFAIGQQDMYNRLLNCELDILEAHAVVRIITPESAELQDDSLSNSPHVIVKYSGQVPPSYMEPMPYPHQLSVTKEALKSAIDDSFGVNESMFGQQSREQAASLMQYATNQGNMIRRRMFNKYTRTVKSVYQHLLNLAIKHWDTSKTIKVLGKEKAFESMDLRGTDIDGGYDLVVEYGTSFSLDPLTRREEILTLMPIFEKAGIETGKILNMLKLTEISGLYDKLQLAADRQREIFDEMGASGLYIAPKELQDHKGMLAYSYEYIMTAEYKYLPQETKNLIEAHIKAREALAAQGAQPNAGMGAPGPAGQLQELPPEAPGMTGEQTGAEQLPPIQETGG